MTSSAKEFHCAKSYIKQVCENNRLHTAGFI